MAGVAWRLGTLYGGANRSFRLDGWGTILLDCCYTDPSTVIAVLFQVLAFYHRIVYKITIMILRSSL